MTPEIHPALDRRRRPALLAAHPRLESPKPTEAIMINYTNLPKGLKLVFTALHRQLVLLGPTYEARRSDSPVLAAYPSIDALLAATKPLKEGKKRRITPDGAAVLCALVELHQRTHHRLWGALLVRAFRPMLCATAKGLVGGSSDDRASILLACFHEALLRLDPSRDPIRIAMYVRQRTRRLVFRELRAERAWDDVGFGEDVDLCPDPSTLEDPRILFARRGAHAGEAHSGGAVAEATIERGALAAFVRRHYESMSPGEQARVYRRLQKRRQRLAARRPVHAPTNEVSPKSRAPEALRWV